MRKWIFAAIVIATLAGCASKGTQDAAPVEDKGDRATGSVPDTSTAPVGGSRVTAPPPGSHRKILEYPVAKAHHLL
jgi:hypothetical protein